jgi:hypothetical protein
VHFRTGFYEDISFTYTIWLNARTAVTINRVVLLYRQRREGGSILSSTSPKHFDIFAQYELVFAEADRIGLDSRTRKHLYDVMINHFVTILQHKGRLAKTDKKRFFEQAAVLAHLAKKAPLALVVHSGGKSLHGWFFCEGRSEESLRQFMNGAVTIGADSATWPPLQFVRMPDGLRDGGARQVIHYFNPEVLK